MNPKKHFLLDQVISEIASFENDSGQPIGRDDRRMPIAQTTVLERITNRLACSPRNARRYAVVATLPALIQSAFLDDKLTLVEAAKAGALSPNAKASLFAEIANSKPAAAAVKAALALQKSGKTSDGLSIIKRKFDSLDRAFTELAELVGRIPRGTTLTLDRSRISKAIHLLNRLRKLSPYRRLNAEQKQLRDLLRSVVRRQ